MLIGCGSAPSLRECPDECCAASGRSVAAARRLWLVWRSAAASGQHSTCRAGMIGMSGWFSPDPRLPVRLCPAWSWACRGTFRRGVPQSLTHPWPGAPSGQQPARTIFRHLRFRQTVLAVNRAIALTGVGGW